ncbi:glycosyltransferase [Flavobacterium sp. LS1R10]|uniref:glycosyltransferase n=1 Tax=Flavobacterium sp. LS1R10 TaxID=2497482 RepID=UPI000F834BD9|nr:glycosyltransferase [Flavobacterium sp. LS1R10]RTY74264.1 glycosyltransferase WbuB [Flavobacterium sp. LS1R10]
MKNIWIIDPYSEKPKPGWRDGRYYLIGKTLSEHGYNVHLFISNFSHLKKETDTNLEEIQVNSNFRIVIVPTIGYKKHISFERIRYEKLFAKNIAKNKQNIPLPSFVIIKEPAIFMFGNLKPLIKVSKAKVIIDIMDLWPELFELKLPVKLRWLGKFIFYPFYYKRKNIIKFASAITAVAPDYLEMGLKINNKVPNKVIYWGCDTASINSLVNSQNDYLLSELNLPSKNNDIWGIYAGTLGESYDIPTLIKAAKIMEDEFPELKFLIAGAGPLEEMVSDCASANKNVFFLGSLPTSQLYQLFKFCDFGFSTYTDASPVSMPIKCYDYLAAGLPLVNSLKRNLGTLIEEHQLGYQYDASDYNSLVNTLKKLMKDKESLVLKKERCKSIGVEFDDHVQYSKFVGLLDELTA